MSNSGRGERAIQELKSALRRTDSPNTVSNNIAVQYRMQGDFRRAFQWWKRTAAYNDGDAWLEIGYCFQYGIGTRRDVAAGIRAYRRAIRSHYNSKYGQEEAQYHLAVALLDRNKIRYRREIERLLRLAAEDGDYPQASDADQGRSRGRRPAR